jgi:formylglycine-generating enzyme required for sulfatase activity
MLYFSIGMSTQNCPKCNDRLEPPEWRCSRCGIVIAPDDPLIGAELSGRHLLLGRLGAGGMAVVYLAVDLEIEGELIAVKILPEDLIADERAVSDLKREVAASRRLSHPHIVRTHDFFRDQKYIYISMEYVPGVTLHELLCQRKRIPLDEVLALCQPLTAAVDYAHRQRVIHRDLKPGNIMLEVKGKEKLTNPDSLKILDFGIARVLMENQTRTTGGSASGTLSYMSPEQMLGGRLTMSSDIYSLSATIYDLLTGNPPFSSGDVPLQILSKTPSLIADIPDVVNDALLQGLSKDPKTRPTTAGEFYQLLARPVTTSVILPVETTQKETVTKATASGKGEVKSRTVRKPARTTFRRLEITAADEEHFFIQEGTGHLMGMVLVPELDAVIGADDGTQAEAPMHELHVSSFLLDRSPVTNEEFERFMPEHSKQRPVWATGSKGDLMPVVNVTWEEALAYARFRGKRLPSETEWEAAARGLRHFLYPWGNDWQDGIAWAGKDWRVGARPAGNFPPNDLGVYSTCGNVWEWCDDRFLPYPGGRTLADMDGSKMVIRGGAWPQPPRLCRASTRWPLDPSAREETVSFRCAADLPK